MDFLEKLKQDPGCLYIYNWGPYIYGLSKECNEYIIIVTDLGKNPEDLGFSDIGGINVIKNNNCTYYFYRMKYWFDKILLNDIDCWECACLNKKYIIKEHVKLMLHTNPVQLRKEIDRDISNEPPELISENKLKYFYWRIIRRCKFANQIIDNHKIINPKEANRDYELLQEANDIEYVYKKLLEVPYSNLKLKTDDSLRKNKIAKIIQKKKKNG